MVQNIGCWFEAGKANFRLYATKAQTVQLHIFSQNRSIPMFKEKNGYWFASDLNFKPGDTYKYSLDGHEPFPDPASRYQPEGVHGVAMGVDLAQFKWKHLNPTLPIPSARVIYELHVGAFTEEGSFDAARKKLAHLQEMGVTLIELMPLADFPGERGWGYDGVSIFAPARCYGKPEDLQAFIDSAHELGIGVLLDVVYNHLGPDGNYTGVYSEDYLNPKHQTPWGDALNFDGARNHALRNFFLKNALYWLQEYHLDGLRLDATHAICDDSSPHFLAELKATIRREIPEREILVYAEDHRNPAYFCKDSSENGYELDGVWADDLHHHLRRHTTGECEGYFAPFDGLVSSITKNMEQGWYRDGSEQSGFLSEGSDPKDLDYSNFVVCIQNHDQIGNRALGDRIHHDIDQNVYKALSALLLFAPETPLLFMGQEWACSSPFQFFTDHNPELGAAITEGRRKEFQGFKAFTDPAQRERIPDPQAKSTFSNSKLNWSEIVEEDHRDVFNLYKAFLQIRLQHPAMKSVLRQSFKAITLSEHSIAMFRSCEEHSILCVVSMEPQGEQIEVPSSVFDGFQWRPILSTNGSQWNPLLQQLQFAYAGAVVFESEQ